MSDTDRQAATHRDESRQRYTLSLEEVMHLFDAAQMPRTLRTLQRYSASGRLDALKIETPTGDAYIVDPQSVERAIGELKMVYADRPTATSRDVSAPVAAEKEPPSLDDQPRPVATERDVSPEPQRAIPRATDHDLSRHGATSHDIFEHPYVQRLERQIERLEERYEAQVRRTEEIQLRAQDKLVELQRMTTIGQSKTLADFMLQAKNWIVGETDDLKPENERGVDNRGLAQ